MLFNVVLIVQLLSYADSFVLGSSNSRNSLSNSGRNSVADYDHGVSRQRNGVPLTMSSIDAAEVEKDFKE